MINLIEIMHFDFTYLPIKIPFIAIGTITETTWKTAHGYNSVFWKIIVESQLLIWVLQCMCARTEGISIYYAANQ